MSIAVIDHPAAAPERARVGVEVPHLSAAPAPGPASIEYDTDPVVVAVQRQAAAASTAARRVTGEQTPEVDPQAWLFAERARYREQGTCDPYAMVMLLRAGLLPTR